jgi:hypothetical protein
MEEELGNRDNNPNNPVVILRFAILASSSDSADRGRSIIRVTETTSFDCHWKNMAIEIGRNEKKNNLLWWLQYVHTLF